MANDVWNKIFVYGNQAARKEMHTLTQACIAADKPYNCFLPEWENMDPQPDLGSRKAPHELIAWGNATIDTYSGNSPLIEFCILLHEHLKKTDQNDFIQTFLKLFNCILKSKENYKKSKVLKLFLKTKDNS